MQLIIWAIDGFIVIAGVLLFFQFLGEAFDQPRQELSIENRRKLKLQRTENFKMGLEAAGWYFLFLLVLFAIGLAASPH